MTSALIISAKALSYTGILFGIGAATHCALGIATSRRWLWVAAAVVLLAVGVRLLGLNLEIVGDPSDLFDFSMFGWMWPGVRVQIFAFLAGAVLIAVAAVFRRPLIAVLGAIVLAVGFGLAGHAQSEGMPGGLWGLVSLHVLIAGFWFLAPLTLWPRSDKHRSDVVHRLQRFSRMAVYAVPLMIVAGLWLALVISDGPGGLIGTPYGRLLLLKTGVITVALALGAYNKVRVTDRIGSGEATALTHLRRTLSLELALFGSALLAVAAATTVFGPHS